MNEIITLVSDTSRRVVFCGLRSIGQAEFYGAQATDLRPELKFIIADYLDYEGEAFVLYGADLYRVIRTYRAGQELELTVARASAEEVELYG